jgi:putative inorganic carbon (hco3(-)) transporter
VLVVLGGAGLAVVSGVVGVLLAAVGLRLGLVPMVILAVVVGALPVGVVVVLARPDLALLLVPLSLPVGARAVPGLPIHVVEVAVVGAVGLAWLGRALRGRRAFAWPPPLLWGVAFVALLVPATAFAFDVKTAFNQLVLISFGLLLAASMAACERDDDMRLITFALVAVGAATCAISLRAVGGLQSQFGGGLVENRAQGPFAQPNDLGTFGNLILFASLGCLVSVRRRSGQIASALAALLGLGAVGLSLSRGAWIGTALGLLVLIVVLPGGRRRLLVLGALLLVTLFGYATLGQPKATSIITQRLGKVFDQSGNPYDTRPEIYRQAVNVIEAHPLVGVGPGGFYESTLKPGAVPGSAALHAHNVLLTVAAEAGILAVCLLVAFTLALALSALGAIRRRGPPGDRRMLAALGCGLIAIVGQGLVDFTLRNPVLLIVVWFFVGMMLARMRPRASRSVDPLEVERRALEVATV